MRRRRHWLPPVLFGATVLCLSLTLLAIGARGPYTHSNLNVAYAAGYDRTHQTLVGAPEPVQRAASMGRSSSGDLAAQGQALFFGLECASCHGLKGQGGVYAPIISGTNAATLKQKTNEGPGGMTPFVGLTDQDLDALAAYLKVATAGAGK
jgi:mono/diheme cytochrome c family protein